MKKLKLISIAFICSSFLLGTPFLAANATENNFVNPSKQPLQVIKNPEIVEIKSDGTDCFFLKIKDMSKNNDELHLIFSENFFKKHKKDINVNDIFEIESPYTPHNSSITQIDGNSKLVLKPITSQTVPGNGDTGNFYSVNLNNTDRDKRIENNIPYFTKENDTFSICIQDKNKKQIKIYNVPVQHRIRPIPVFDTHKTNNNIFDNNVDVVDNIDSNVVSVIGSMNEETVELKKKKKEVNLNNKEETVNLKKKEEEVDLNNKEEVELRKEKIFTINFIFKESFLKKYNIKKCSEKGGYSYSLEIVCNENNKTNKRYTGQMFLTDYLSAYNNNITTSGKNTKENEKNYEKLYVLSGSYPVYNFLFDKNKISENALEHIRKYIHQENLKKSTDKQQTNELVTSENVNLTLLEKKFLNMDTKGKQKFFDMFNNKKCDLTIYENALGQKTPRKKVIIKNVYMDLDSKKNYYNISELFSDKNSKENNKTEILNLEEKQNNQLKFENNTYGEQQQNKDKIFLETETKNNPIIQNKENFYFPLENNNQKENNKTEMLDLEENQIIKNNDNSPLVIKKASCKSNRFGFILTKEFFEKNNLSTSDKYIIKIKNKNNQKRYTKPAVFKNNEDFYTMKGCPTLNYPYCNTISLGNLKKAEKDAFDMFQNTDCCVTLYKENSDKNDVVEIFSLNDVHIDGNESVKNFLNTYIRTKTMNL